MLPDSFSNEYYWSEMYLKPIDYWQPVINEIAAQHHLGGDWERARLGRNIVFLNEAYVLKISPPGWKEDISREAKALSLVGNLLPVTTPEILVTGEVEAWGYLIQRKLDGQNLHELWSGLSQTERVKIASQHGEILDALHNLGAGNQDWSGLEFDWVKLYASQREVCQNEMAAAGVPTALVDDAELFLDRTAPLLAEQGDAVLLHGDLTHLNFLVAEDGDGWRICGLIDWGDVKIGPRGHEYISPGVHMYLGDRPVIEAFYQACSRIDPEELMARALLYYTGGFADYLKKLSGGIECQSWRDVAERLW